jgi:hypothetical protein
MNEFETILWMMVLQHFKNFILPEWMFFIYEVSQGVQIIFLITADWFSIGTLPSKRW